MRRISLLIAVIGAIALVPASAGASCPERVRLGGSLYIATTTSRPLPAGAPVGGGVVPGCDDAIALDPQGNRLNPKPPDVPVALHRIRGVPAALALARPDRPGVVFLAPGTLPQLAGHPLHRALFGSRRRPRADHGACAVPRTIRGTLVTFPGPHVGLAVRTPGGQVLEVALEAATRVRSARRTAGQPRLLPGDTLTVTGPRCAQGPASVLVARRIRAR